MAQALMRPKGSKQQVRWRVGGGSGPQEYLSFDTKEEGQAAVDLINQQNCAITKDNVIAVLNNLSPVQLAQVKAEIAAVKAEKTGLPTVVQLIPEWIKSKELEAEGGTLDKYQALLRTAWIPTIGDMRIDTVTEDDIRAVMKAMNECACRKGKWGSWCERRKANQKLSPDLPHEPGVEKRTQDRYYSVIRGLFLYAVRKRKITHSPVADAGYKTQSLVKYNSTKKEEKHFYLTEEQFALVRSKFPPDIQVMLDLVGETGLRYSEVTALYVQQFLKGSKPKININEVWKRSKDKGLYRGEPKGGSTRVLRISPMMGLKLEKLCEGKKNGELIFTSRYGARLEANNFFRDIWEPAVLAAQRCPEHPPVAQERVVSEGDLLGPKCGDNGGLNARGKPCGTSVVVGTDRCYLHVGVARRAVSTCDCTDPKFPRRIPRSLVPHDLRHTYASWMIKRKTHLTVMARRLGQGTSQVTEQVYAGILDEVDDQVAEESAIMF